MKETKTIEKIPGNLIMGKAKHNPKDTAAFSQKLNIMHGFNAGKRMGEAMLRARQQK